MFEKIRYLRSQLILIYSPGNSLMESHSIVPVEGHTWAIHEVSEQSQLVNLYRFKYILYFNKKSIRNR